MKREHFEHAVRAAGSVLGASKVLVIGSQALHTSVTGELPVEALRSVEVDVAAMVLKAIAGRPKDIEFCRALVERGLVDGDRLRDRLAHVDALDTRIQAAVLARIPA